MRPKQNVCKDNRKLLHRLQTLFLTILLLASLNAAATRRYVDASSTATNPDGLSWATAYTKFEAAVSAAISGDVIWVAKGTYQPAAGTSYTLKTGVEIYGGFTNTDTDISQRNWETNLTQLKGNGNRVFFNDHVAGTPVLDGFTVSDGVNGFFYGGGGMCNDNSSPLLTNIIFRDNHLIDGTVGSPTLPWGAGLFNSESSPVLTHVKFINNICTSAAYQANGAGMYNQDSNPVLNNVIFSGNRCESSATETGHAMGAGIYNIGSSLVYNNVVFDHNVCVSPRYTYGGAIGNINCPKSLLTNVVFESNEAYYGAAVHSYQSDIVVAHATFVNNIAKAYSNSMAFIVQSSTAKVTNCLFFNNFWDLGVFTPVSTTINNSFINLNGYTVSGSNNITTNLLSPFVDDTAPKGPDGLWMTDDDGLRLAYDAAVSPINKGETITAQFYPAQVASAALADIKGTARPVGPAYDMGAYEGGVDRAIIYVDITNTAGTHDGLSWATAFDKLEDALDPSVSDSGSPIWVAMGTYQPPVGESYSMNKLNRIYGGFKNTDTSLDQRDWVNNKTILKGNGNRVINNDFAVTGIHVSNAAQLDGFTVTGGDAQAKGGGMYNYLSSPFITNVIFDGNHAVGSGGGMYNYTSHPSLYNVSFIDNTTKANGAGMYNAEAQPVLNKVLFINNAADGSGGGMANYNHGSIDIKNVVFENNTATNGGAVSNDWTEPDFTNVVFSGNTATNQGGVL